MFAQTAFGVSAIAFGGLSWALDGSAAPVAAVMRLEQSMAAIGTLAPGPSPRPECLGREIRFRDVTFNYGATDRPVLDGFDLTIPAGDVDGHRGPERGGQDDAGQAAVPAV